MKPYLWNILVSLDQLVNAVFAGVPDETLSSRLGKRAFSGECFLCQMFCWVLEAVHPGHCQGAIEQDRRKRLPPAA